MIKYLSRITSRLSDKFWRAKQKYRRFCKNLPILENTVLLESEHGKKMDGNIYYIAKLFANDERYSDYTVYVSSLGRNMKSFAYRLRALGKNAPTPVMLSSPEYVRLLASAKFLINDTSFPPYFVKRKEQIYLNTWHGTPMKTLGRANKSDYHTLGNIQKNFISCDYLLCQNEYSRDILMRDYMIKNLHLGTVILSGYPRNEIFFDKQKESDVRARYALGNKRVYCYMPTYRGYVSKGKNEKSSVYLSYHLYEIDKNLFDSEIMFVNLHPLSADRIDFSKFKRIKPFPKNVEPYEILASADALVTDYSSVVFDFAVSEKKTVLFPYDLDDYSKERGLYISPLDLPFPLAFDVPTLLSELRKEGYTADADFRQRFCTYDTADATKRLCDAVFLGRLRGVKTEKNEKGKKENVLIYAGNLSKNGITASLLSLLSLCDTEKRNYYVAYKTEIIKANKSVLMRLPENVGYIGMLGDINLTLGERVIRVLFKKKLISARIYVGLLRDAIRMSRAQYFPEEEINYAIHFNGYEAETMLLFSEFDCTKFIFVHNDMEKEIKVKKNQRRDVLKYVYRKFDRVLPVTEDLISSTAKIAGGHHRLTVVKNTVNHEEILKKSQENLTKSSYKKATVSFDELSKRLASQNKKFISVGRFSEEKGQKRLLHAFSRYKKEEENAYLFIVGGYSVGGIYEELCSLISSLGLSESVALVYGMDNPYSLMKRCDFLILPSLYEGFGLVIAEADILGLPVASTDIDGPRLFMERHGGYLTENSEEGILRALTLLSQGRITPMNIDFSAYNREAVEEFEKLFSKEGE